MNSWLAQNLVECLGWTLVHFVWQGFIVAALFAAWIRLFPNATSSRRYVFGCAALLFLALAPVITFRYVQIQTAASFSTSAAISRLTPENISNEQAQSPEKLFTIKPLMGEMNFSQRLQRSLPWVVFGWSLGVLALSGRLLAGWLLVRRIKCRATVALDELWHLKMGKLSRRLGMTGPIGLLQSALVEVPTVIGWLRPVILLPAGCLAGLSAAQLESIIAHELAHIRRHDYLVNLLQSVVETLLFYHPGVWWVSRRIREERENCCDDLAVEICGDRLTYARALATLEELRHASGQLALAAAGAPLLQRIRRLAGHSGTKASRPGWPLAGIAALVIVFALAMGLRGNRVLAADETNNQATNAIDSNAILMVRPASKDLDNAETNLPKSIGPKEIVVAVKFFEIDETRSHKRGLDWFFNHDLADAVTNKVPDAKTFAPKIAPPVVPDPLPSVTNSILLQICGILDRAGFKKKIAELEHSDGVDELNAPKVLTESGRQAQIQAVTITTVVTGVAHSRGTNGQLNFNYQTAKIPCGAVIDLLPTIAGDGEHVTLKMIPSVTEFVGYDDPSSTGKPLKYEDGPLKAVEPLPHFRLRQMAAEMSVADGDTIVLGGLAAESVNVVKDRVPYLGSIPLLGKLFVSTSITKTRKNILVFVTPTMVNPDGTRFRPVAENSAEEKMK